MNNTTTPRQPIAMIVLSLILLSGLIVISIVLISSFGSAAPAPTEMPSPTNTPDMGSGAEIIPINPPQALTNFVAADANGDTISLSDLRGKWALLYFGYINCPDFCPLTMTEFVQVKSMLGERADQFNFVLVSIDPERDTPEALQTYLANFDPAFIGMLGDLDTLRPLEAEYGLSILFPDAGTPAGNSMPGMDGIPMTAIDGGYIVDHTTYSYLIDPDGNLRAIFSFNTSAEAMIAEFERVSAS